MNSKNGSNNNIDEEECLKLNEKHETAIKPSTIAEKEPKMKLNVNKQHESDTELNLKTDEKRSENNEDADSKFDPEPETTKLNYKNVDSKSYVEILKIKKPLILSRVATYLCNGMSSSQYMYIDILLRQRGLSIAEISFIYILLPFIQIHGPFISGGIADKYGRLKPVVVGNLTLSVLCLCVLLLLPSIDVSDCEVKTIPWTCNDAINLTDHSACDNSPYMNCDIYCWLNVSNFDSICDNISVTYSSEVLNASSLMYKEVLTLKSNETLILSHSTQNLSKIQTLLCNQASKQNCSVSCEMQTYLTKKQACVNISKRPIIFGFYALTVVLLFTFNQNFMRLLDVVVMNVSTSHNSSFGHERIFNLIGRMTLTPFCGYLIGVTSANPSFQNYNTMLYLCITLTVLALFVIYKLDLQPLVSKPKMMKKFFNSIRHSDIFVFFLIVLVSGTCTKLATSFTNIHLTILGAPSLLLGLRATCAGLYGIPFLLYSDFFVDKIGYKALLLIAFAATSMHHMFYSLLKNPWWALAIEVSCIFKTHLYWVAVILHSNDIAPEGLIATFISTVGVIQFVIGSGTGSLLGGLTMSKYGPEVANIVISILAGMTGLLYAFYLYMRHRYRK